MLVILNVILGIKYCLQDFLNGFSLQVQRLYSTTVIPVIKMFLAEFAFQNTAELVNELLIQASSERDARSFAQEYASNWGLDLFAFTLLDEHKAQVYQRMGKAVTLHSAQMV